MNEKKTRTKYVHEGNYVAEVEVQLLAADESWSPYISLEDAYRLDDVREALKKNDTKEAAKYGTIYKLHKVS
jgi:hypothetical protein